MSNNVIIAAVVAGAVGIGAGYAWFIADKVSIEPGLRYNHSLNDDYSDKGIFQINIGFALYF